VSKRKVGNPLALVVLCLLLEKPMHPYEMAFTLRVRHKEESIKLNYGSLYTVVEALQREQLIEVRDVVREGRRPERTVYGLTKPGRVELFNWMAELLGRPNKEYPQFATALSLIGVLPPAKAAGLLQRRAGRLEHEIEETRFVLESMLGDGFERLFIIEAEYELTLKEAELEFTRSLIGDIESGKLTWPEEAKALHLRAEDDAVGSGDLDDDKDEDEDEDEEAGEVS
jgi:DNA-binding PadR family transcriptional regulator